ncbi:MAG: hypothetical protein ACRBBS_18160 [Thalassovita sp.]
MLFALVTFAILSALSLRADRSLPEADHLPMQWNVAGQVTWSAPRRFALAFIPVLALLMMLGIALIPEQHGQMLAQWISVVSFVGAHLFYLWLVRRHLR